jgi:hypothetical protein
VAGRLVGTKTWPPFFHCSRPFRTNTELGVRTFFRKFGSSRQVAALDRNRGKTSLMSLKSVRVAEGGHPDHAHGDAAQHTELSAFGWSTVSAAGWVPSRIRPTRSGGRKASCSERKTR